MTAGHRVVKAAVLAVLAAGCVTSYQSARTLAPGRTQVTVGAGRAQRLDRTAITIVDDDALYAGDVQLRHGLRERLDAGVRLQRAPGRGGLSILSVEPKYVLVAGTEARLSAGLPLGLLWTERDGDVEDGMLLVTPTLLAGLDLAPSLELVLAAKATLIKPNDGPAETSLGGTLGLRAGDAAQRWAVHPEVGIQRLSDGGEADWYVTFGLGIAAGN